MKNLTINDLKLGLMELLNPNGPRFPVLSATKAWGFYAADLQKKQKELQALPPEVTGATRQATEVITETDELHDGFGGAIYYHTESYLRAPDATRAIKHAAQELRDAFITKLSELRGSYSDEASRAQDRQRSLETHKERLQLFPIAGGKTLYEWAVAYVANGLKLGELMSARALTEASLVDPLKSKAKTLRAEAISLLINLRSLLQQELKQDPTLPANIDALLFRLFDELQQKRHAAVAPTMPSFPALSPPIEEE